MTVDELRSGEQPKGEMVALDDNNLYGARLTDILRIGSETVWLLERGRALYFLCVRTQRLYRTWLVRREVVLEAVDAGLFQ